MASFAKGNAEACLASPDSIDKTFMREISDDTMLCDPTFLYKLMEDHTALDWRPILKHKWKGTQVLNMAGGKSGIFPVAGVAYINELIGDKAVNKMQVYEESSHWLYIEEPRVFVDSICAFTMGKE